MPATPRGTGSLRQLREATTEERHRSSFSDWGTCRELRLQQPSLPEGLLTVEPPRNTWQTPRLLSYLRPGDLTASRSRKDKDCKRRGHVVISQKITISEREVKGNLRLAKPIPYENIT